MVAANVPSQRFNLAAVARLVRRGASPPFFRAVSRNHSALSFWVRSRVPTSTYANRPQWTTVRLPALVQSLTSIIRCDELVGRSELACEKAIERIRRAYGET